MCRYIWVYVSICACVGSAANPVLEDVWVSFGNPHGHLLCPPPPGGGSGEALCLGSLTPSGGGACAIDGRLYSLPNENPRTGLPDPAITMGEGSWAPHLPIGILNSLKVQIQYFLRTREGRARGRTNLRSFCQASAKLLPSFCQASAKVAYRLPTKVGIGMHTTGWTTPFSDSSKVKNRIHNRGHDTHGPRVRTSS